MKSSAERIRFLMLQAMGKENNLGFANYLIEQSGNKVNFSEGSIRSWTSVDKPSKPTEPRLSAMAQIFDVDATWITHGVGKGPSGGEIFPESPTIAIPLYDIYAGAGGNGNIVSEKTEEFIYMSKNLLGESKIHNLAAFKVSGDSMSPTINDAECIIFDRTDATPSYGVFVVRIDGGIQVKRLQPVPGGKVVLISDNKSYLDYEVSSHHDFEILGKVILRVEQIN